MRYPAQQRIRDARLSQHDIGAALDWMCEHWRRPVGKVPMAAAVSEMNSSTLRNRLARGQTAERDGDGFFTCEALVHTLVADRLLRYGVPFDSLDDAEWDPESIASWVYSEVKAKRPIGKAVIVASIDGSGAVTVRLFPDGEIEAAGAWVTIEIGAEVRRIALELYARREGG